MRCFGEKPPPGAWALGAGPVLLHGVHTRVLPLHLPASPPPSLPAEACTSLCTCTHVHIQCTRYTYTHSYVICKKGGASEGLLSEPRALKQESPSPVSVPTVPAGLTCLCSFRAQSGVWAQVVGTVEPDSVRPREGACLGHCH